MIRNLDYNDYDKQYINLLSQLSICDMCSKNKFKEFVNRLNKFHNVIVYEENGIIIGTGTIFLEHKLLRNSGLVGHIEDVVVDKQHRNKGIGKKIVETLIKYAYDNKCYKISLNCTEENSEFYKKIGLEKKEIQMVKYF
jgi:glucosamine-phosphate N-acetyltransferase